MSALFVPHGAPMQALLQQLEAFAKDRTTLAELDEPTRKRLLEACSRIVTPAESERRRLQKALRQRDRKKQFDADALALKRTKMRQVRTEGKVAGPLPLHALPGNAVSFDGLRVGVSSSAAASNAAAQGTAPPDDCFTQTDGPSLDAADAAAFHVTATGFSGQATLSQPRNCYICKAPYTSLHHFYDSMCGKCGDLNFYKRTELADLTGRVALVTGGRVKIGQEIVRKLVRCGAHVVVTTRFPVDAMKRYADLQGQVTIVGLDLRHTPSVEKFCAQFPADRLDFIINNACQTVRRPAAFYAHMMEEERKGLTTGAFSSAELSQTEVLPEDALFDKALFPVQQFDADGQQIDLRKVNSWRLRLHEVPTPELLETQLVNAVAPFVINARLKPLMLRSQMPGKHIVNVSAMEGQFNRGTKTDKHPHTNMAKAALNMLTRTSASDYARDGIFMNSVDTGWVTDEDPAEHAVRKELEGFQPPLDIVDGAARVLDPIVTGQNTGRHVYGCFLKDYTTTAW